jgi:hypothetical protein
MPSFQIGPTGPDLYADAARATRGRSVTLLPDRLQVDVGDPRIFTCMIPLDRIRAAGRVDDPGSVGTIHGWRNRWQVDAGWGFSVSIHIHPPVVARVERLDGEPSMPGISGAFFRWLFRARNVRVKELVIGIPNLDLVREIEQLSNS